MKKTEIYVEITNEQERLRAIEILQNAGEYVWENSRVLKKSETGFLIFYNNNWVLAGLKRYSQTKISIDQLEVLLTPNKSNVFTDVQEWIRENTPELIWVFTQKEEPECFKNLKQHLINDYPKGTEIKISKDKIEIYHS